MDGLIELSLRYGPYVVILGVIVYFFYVAISYFGIRKEVLATK